MTPWICPVCATVNAPWMPTCGGKHTENVTLGSVHPMSGVYHFRLLGGPRYEASNRLAKVDLIVRGDVIEILAGDQPFAGTPLADFQQWTLGRPSTGTR